MNKLTALSILALLFVSCNEGVPVQRLDDPQNYTTTNIQNLQKDTVIVSLDRDVIYIFDQHNLVRYKIVNMYKPGDQMVLVPFYVFLLFTLLITIFIVFVVNKIR